MYGQNESMVKRTGKHLHDIRIGLDRTSAFGDRNDCGCAEGRNDDSESGKNEGGAHGGQAERERQANPNKTLLIRLLDAPRLLFSSDCHSLW